MFGHAINKAFVRSVKRIAKELAKPEWEVTKAEFFEYDTEEIKDWDLRKAGGFTSLRKMYFPPEDNLEVKYGSKLVSAHRNKLEKAYGQALFFETELLRAVKEHLAANPFKLHPATKPPKHASTKALRTIVAAISDTHFGANISTEELHGLNEYSWTVASRRMALFVEQIAQYKMDHRAETDLVLQLNGDILAGQIHNQEWFVDLLAVQFAGTVSILAQAITYLAQHFGRVRVVCTTGNHGRNVGKADKGRATTHKWDSYESMVYLSLREILGQKHKNVEFLIPEAPFALYKVQGHNVFQTHGDTVLNVGNPGNSLNMKAISEQVNQINSSDLIKPEEKIEIVSVGHVHVPTAQILQNGAVALINGCLSGIDPFAQSIGIFSNNPTQLLMECTDKHAVGDIRMIQVKVADRKAYYDKIITPFDGKFNS